MRRVAALVITALTAAACGTGTVDVGGPGSTTTAAPTTTQPPATTTVTYEGESPQIYAAALLELVTKDNTFGGGPPPFTVYLILDDLDPYAGSPTGGAGPSTALTDQDMSAIEAALDEFGEVKWIDDPDEWRTDDLMPMVEGGVILGVGEIEYDDKGALVPVSLWCGGLCGTWLTYRLVEEGDVWNVTGIEGPVSIS
jgi:hypothetical protein